MTKQLPSAAALEHYRLQGKVIEGYTPGGVPILRAMTKEEIDKRDGVAITDADGASKVVEELAAFREADTPAEVPSKKRRMIAKAKEAFAARKPVKEKKND